MYSADQRLILELQALNFYNSAPSVPSYQAAVLYFSRRMERYALLYLTGRNTWGTTQEIFLYGESKLLLTEKVPLSYTYRWDHFFKWLNILTDHSPMGLFRANVSKH